MKASLSTADHGRTSLIAPYERAASPKKLVRRDEVARPYGVSGSVKNILSHNSKNNLCLLCVRSEDKHLYKRVYEAISLKETFWLLLRIWAKVTRPAGRNKGWEYKAFEWKQSKP